MIPSQYQTMALRILSGPDDSGRLLANACPPVPAWHLTTCRSAFFFCNIMGAFVAVDPLLPIRTLAGIALLAMVSAFIYVLRHLRRLNGKPWLRIWYRARSDHVIIWC